MSARILSQSEIISLMKAGDIRIAYYSVYGADRSLIKLPEKRFVKLDEVADEDELDKQARAYFLESLEPDSFVLRIGPYAKLEKPSGLKSLPNTFERVGDVILNVHKNGFIPLRPHEHLVIGTNEYIEVSSKIGGSGPPVDRHKDRSARSVLNRGTFARSGQNSR